MNAEHLSVLSPVFHFVVVVLGETSPLFVSNYFLGFTAFVGLNLFQSGFTSICPLSNILARLA